MLTASERRGALVVAALLLLGAGYDLWRARATVPPVEAPAVAPAAAAPPSTAEASAAPAPADAKLDLNRAGIAELDRLPGIGPTLARRIVAHRRAHGPFREVAELLAVRGIGPRLLGRIEPLLAVSGPPGGPAAVSGRADSAQAGRP